MHNQEIYKAPVWRISRHRLNTDGFGVTTLVAFDGCPLNCNYCINPDAKNNSNFKHNKILTPRELFEIVNKDNLYFVYTHGGVTFGGGEPLIRYKFIKDFASLCHSYGWRIRIETSLNVPNDAIKCIADYIEHWYVDIKDLNKDIYMQYTGLNNELVIQNLKWLANNVNVEKVTIRVPSIIGFNSSLDVRNSIDKLHSMGFGLIDELEYLTPDKIEQRKSTKNPLLGKSICNRLKSVRLKIAEKYGIPYKPHKCTFQGQCRGTCPLCEQEVDWLEKEIKLKS